MKRLFTIISMTMLPALAFAAPWDILRPVVGVTESLNVIISVVVLLVALVMAIIAGKAVRKHDSKKMRLVFAAFGLFLAKLLLSFMDLYFSPGNFMNNAVMNAFDLVILVCLFMAIFRK